MKNFLKSEFDLEAADPFSTLPDAGAFTLSFELPPPLRFTGVVIAVAEEIVDGVFDFTTEVGFIASRRGLKLDNTDFDAGFVVVPAC